MSHKSVSGNKCLEICVVAIMRHSEESTVAAPKTRARIGYMRVSTVTQTLDRGVGARSGSISKTFSDKMSGHVTIVPVWPP